MVSNIYYTTRRISFKPMNPTLKQLKEEVERMKEVEEILPPRLFQLNATPNEYGGYSSVPFYCSLCQMGEGNIQDNKTKEGYYYCNCSVWTNSCGGKWVRWLKSEKEAREIAERFYPNSFNKALDKVLELIKEKGE